MGLSIYCTPDELLHCAIFCFENGVYYHATLFSYLMVAGAIDWNICPKVLGMTKGSIARGHPPSAKNFPWPNGKCSSLLHLKPLNNRFITWYLTKKVFFFMSAKHYQVLIIYIYTAYISLAFNKYSILTLSFRGP
jgi:hypothetical protein